MVDKIKFALFFKYHCLLNGRKLTIFFIICFEDFQMPWYCTKKHLKAFNTLTTKYEISRTTQYATNVRPPKWK